MPERRRLTFDLTESAALLARLGEGLTHSWNWEDGEDWNQDIREAAAHQETQWSKLQTKESKQVDCLLAHTPHDVLQAYEVEEREDGLSALTFTVPRSESSGAVNNKRETFSFR